jgi:ABC-type glycerol-3-phosphate transport system substrate-binding protein
VGKLNTHTISRRDFVRRGAGLASAVALGDLLAACGGSDAQPQASGGTPQGTVSVWMHEEAVYHKLFDRLAKEYEAANPKVKVKPLHIPFENFDTKLLTAFTGGKPPDVAKFGAWELANYASKGLLAPVNPTALGKRSDSEVQSAYASGALTPVTYQGKMYGLPIDFNSIFLFYRRDHFEKAGLDPDKPPATWEELADYGKQLAVGSGGHLKRAGFQWLQGDPVWGLMQALPLVQGLGGRIVSEDGSQGTLATPEGIKAVEYYANVNRSGIGSADLTGPNGIYGLFADGKVSMYLSANFSTTLVPALNPKARFGETFDVAPIPQWASASDKVASGYSWAWGVSQASENQYTAWHFVNFMESKEAADAQLKVSGLITPFKGWQDEAVAKSPSTQIVAEQLPYTDFGPRIPQWSQMAKALVDNIDAAANGQKSPEQAAKDFDSAMAGVL